MAGGCVVIVGEERRVGVKGGVKCYGHCYIYLRRHWGAWVDVVIVGGARVRLSMTPSVLGEDAWVLVGVYEGGCCGC